jgi:hypothetical protein
LKICLLLLNKLLGKYIVLIRYREMFENTKAVIRSRKSKKGRQSNDQKNGQKDKQ